MRINGVEVPGRQSGCSYKGRSWHDCERSSSEKFYCHYNIRPDYGGEVVLIYGPKFISGGAFMQERK